MTKYKLKVGDVIQSNSSCTYTITALLPTGKVSIKFNDEFGYEVTSDRSSIIHGNIKNPYQPKLFGKGYFGVGRFKSKNGSYNKGFPNTEEYQAWINMLSRCYDPNYIQRNTGNKVYEGTTVCNEWLNFQAYAEWFTSNIAKIRALEPNLRLAVDKDILSSSKVYSPETCAIVPMEVNSVLIGCMHILNGSRNKSMINNKDGTYSLLLSSKGCTIAYHSSLSSVEEANKIYIAHKLKQMKDLAEKYKHILEERVYIRMLNYS